MGWDERQRTNDERQHCGPSPFVLSIRITRMGYGALCSKKCVYHAIASGIASPTVAPASWPHAAAIDMPRSTRTVQAIPRSTSSR